MAIALCAAGCFSDRGVAIEVNVGDTGATEVELYLGKVACKDVPGAPIDCTGIAPPSVEKILRGEVWFRDTAARYTADVKGRTATFRLQADTTILLPIVIAVGTVPTDPDHPPRPVGTATMLDLEVPAHDARVATTKLVEAHALAAPGTGPRPVGGEERVAVWAQPKAPSACLAVEHWSSETAMDRIFIVPEDDPDCDELTVNECNPAAYLGSNRSGGAPPKLDCATEGSAGTCVLGSFECRDGQGTTSSCLAMTAAPLCVPAGFCSCEDLDPTCILAELAKLDPVPPQLECDVPMAEGGKPCAADVDRRAEINLDGKFTQVPCGPEPLIGGLLGGFAKSHEFRGAVFELGSASEACHFPIKWTGGALSMPEGGDDRGTIELKTREGGVVLPLVLHFKPAACDAIDLRCDLTGDESDPMWTCTQ